MSSTASSSGEGTPPPIDGPSGARNDDNGASNNQPAAPARVEKKRRRPPLACEQCRKRKIRCDRKQPCNHCVKANIPSCTYAPSHVPASRAGAAARAAAKERNPSPPPAGGIVQSAQATPAGHAQGMRASPVDIANLRISPSEAIKPTYGPVRIRGTSSSVPSTSTPGSTSDASSVERLVARVHELEAQLRSVGQLKDQPGGEALQPGDDGASFNKGSVMKTRYFGESHWMNATDMLPVELSVLARAERECNELYQVLRRCKNLGRKIKQARVKPLNSAKLMRTVPARDLCDTLTELYINHYEGVFRILHVPIFRAEYERFWVDRSSVSEAFIIELQLVLALGATLYDERFSLRPAATQWVYEAQLWLMLPPEKSRMSIIGLQIMCLIVLAKSSCAVGQDLTWITTGSLVRKAMYMGMHRDPSHLAHMTTYTTEMRRRLWATILELNLQSAFDSGGSPLLASSDYDTRPPQNLDDEQLSNEDGAPAPVEHPANVPTRTSVQIALMRSLPLRVAMLKHVNDFRAAESYEETLRLNSQITKHTRAMSSSLTALSANSRLDGGGGGFRITKFHTYVAEFFMYRCFHALHQPVVLRHFEDPKFYFSRKIQLDSAFQVMHRLGMSGPLDEDPAAAQFRRLCTNGTGMFRSIPTQSLMAMIVQLIYRTEEQATSMGYLPSNSGDSDLRSVIVAADRWNLERVRAGETNIKGHLLIGACLAHVDAISNGAELPGIEEQMMRNATEGVYKGWDALVEIAQREGVPVDTTSMTVEDGNFGLVGADPGTAESDPMDMDGLPTSWVDWMGDLAWDDMSQPPWPRFASGPYDEFSIISTGQMQ